MDSIAPWMIKRLTLRGHGDGSATLTIDYHDGQRKRYLGPYTRLRYIFDSLAQARLLQRDRMESALN